MHDKQRIESEIDLVSVLRLLAESYEEISVLRMQKVRGSVLRNREFFEDISSVFSDVKNSYQDEISKLLKTRGAKKVSFSTLVKNGKTVSVFVSANARLYGNITARVWEVFEQAVRRDGSDIVIIGALGKDLYKQSGMKREYTYFDIPDYGILEAHIKPVIAHIIRYEHVNVYYGKFINVIQQAPSISRVSGEQAVSGKPKERKRFLFEPSLETVLNFFETQISYSLFRQTLHESQLSLLASRINAMEEAVTNINLRAKMLEGERRRVKRSMEGRKQLETFAGISLWLRA